MKKVLVVWILILLMLAPVEFATAESVQEKSTEELYQMLNEITAELSTREEEYAKTVAQRLIEAHAADGSRVITENSSGMYSAFMDLGEKTVKMYAGKLYGGYEFMFSGFDSAEVDLYARYIADFIVAINPEIMHEAAYANALKMFMTDFAYTSDGKAMLTKQEFGLNIMLEVSIVSDITALKVAIK